MVSLRTRSSVRDCFVRSKGSRQQEFQGLLQSELRLGHRYMADQDCILRPLFHFPSKEEALF